MCAQGFVPDDLVTSCPSQNANLILLFTRRYLSPRIPPRFLLLFSLAWSSLRSVNLQMYMDRPNLTVLTHALVTRITFAGKRATGVECIYNGETNRISAGLEVVLSLGAIHTPKVLMQSGIGDQTELERPPVFLFVFAQRFPGNREDELHFSRTGMRGHDLPAVIKFLEIHRGVP
jgi:hypothetical protein